MRILYITNGDGYSGSSIALNNIIKSLKDEIDCEVVFPRNIGDFSRTLTQYGIRCHHLRYVMNVYPNNNKVIGYWINLVYTIIVNYIAVYKVLKIVREFKPDLIHTNVGPLDLGYKVSKKLGIPHIWHIREYLKDNDCIMRPMPSLEIFNKKYNQPINYCIAVTSGIYNYYNLDKRSTVIYDGVLPEQETKYTQKNNYFLYVGRLQEDKGDMCLLESYRKYIKLGGYINLYLVGIADENRLNVLTNYVTTNNLQNHIKFLGYRKDVFNLMAKAKALIVTSKFEGFGFTVAEAMYNHCLVVGRNTTGIKEQFDNGLKIQGREIGVRFESDEELPQIMMSLEKINDKLYTDIAYRTVCQLYKIKVNAEKIINYYINVIKNHQNGYL